MLPQVRRIGQHAAVRAHIRQEQLGDHLDGRLGAGWRYDVDLPGRRIIFSGAQGQVTGRAQLLTSVASSPSSLLWGWSQVFASQAGPDPAAAAFHRFGREHNLSELVTEEAPYEVPAGLSQADVIATICHDVGAAATVVFGPEVLYYTLPTGNGAGRIVLLVDELSAPLPPLTLTDAFVKLPRLLQEVDEVAWSLDGLARFTPGWSLEPGDIVERTHHYTLLDENGAWAGISVTFHPDGRVEQVSLQGVHQP